MKARVMFITAWLGVLASIGGRACAQSHIASDRKAITALYNQYNAVLNTRDFGQYRVFAQRAVAPDYFEVGTDGKKTGRQQGLDETKQFLATVKPPVRNVSYIQKIEMQGQNTAVVLVRFEGSCRTSGPDGKLHRFSRKGRDKETLVRMPVGWQWKQTQHLEAQTLIDGKSVNENGTITSPDKSTGHNAVKNK